MKYWFILPYFDQTHCQHIKNLYNFIDSAWEFTENLQMFDILAFF